MARPLIAMLMLLLMDVRAEFTSQGIQRACRADAEGKDGGREGVAYERYMARGHSGGLTECEERCVAMPGGCTGIELVPYKYCEVWLVPILGTAPLPAGGKFDRIECFKYEIPEGCEEVTTDDEKGAVIFLHGSQHRGVKPDVKRLLRSIHCKTLPSLMAKGWSFHFPTASAISYTQWGGDLRIRWFDSTELDPSVPELTESIESRDAEILRTVQQVLASGRLSAKDIIIGGYSNGGGMSLQFALRHPDLVGGVFVLSNYAYTDSKVFDLLENNETLLASARKLTIFMAHGDDDKVIELPWARATWKRLLDLGLNVTFFEFDSIGHEMTVAQLDALEAYLGTPDARGGNWTTVTGAVSDGTTETDAADVSTTNNVPTTNAPKNENTGKSGVGWTACISGVVWAVIALALSH